VRQEFLRAAGTAEEICLAGMLGSIFCGGRIDHHPADGIYFEGQWGCGHLAMSDSSFIWWSLTHEIAQSPRGIRHGQRYSP
jgi:hypothetical protein